MMKILFVFGTRPEGIKMAPLIKEVVKEQKLFDSKICITGQHRELLSQVLDFFDLREDFNLKIMTQNQSLFDITAKILKGLEDVLDRWKPDLVIVQGDTSTAFSGALAAYYNKIRVAHVEAGLRSMDKYSPFPEEINRIVVDFIADYKFAPTQKAAKNLRANGIRQNVYVVGNTVIDALLLGLKFLEKKNDEYLKEFRFLNSAKKLIFVTAHRRENFGQPIKNISSALKDITARVPDVQILFSVHPNPNVRAVVKKALKKCQNIYLIDPLEYSRLIWILKRSYIILADSGGLQEEASYLGKPVLVLRNVTERSESISAKVSKLVGTDKHKIVDGVITLVKNRKVYKSMARSVQIYGNGSTSKKIVRILKKINGTI